MAKANSANAAQASEQVKLVLRWIVKYRFWLILGLSALLPMIGYIVGSGPIQKATADEVGKIKGADSGVAPYTSPGVVNDQWKPIVDEKKAVLSKDVNKAWEKIYSRQAPLLKWPDVVEQRFHEWGRKWPENVDLGAVQKAIDDYVNIYEKAVDETFKKVRPWDYVEGTGVVVVPDKMTLLRPSIFDPASPPSLSKVWSAQERLWIQGTLLDAVATINGKAKGWDDAVVKQINALVVGSPLAQDQKSLVEGKTVKIADEIVPPGGTPTAAAETSGAGMPGSEAAARMAGMPGMPGGSGMATQVPDDVYHLDVPSDQYTIIPVSMTVLVDQNRLPEFLVGLENSPMAIQVLEFEMLKPVNPVVKPVKGDPASFNGMGMGMMMPGAMGMPGDPSRMMRMPMPGGEGGRMGMPNVAGMMNSMYGPGRGDMGGPAAKKGIDVRTKERAKEREEREKKRKALGRAIDTYYDIVEVTVYGQARFYNPPPAPPAEAASPGESAAPDAAKADEAKKDETKADEAKKDETKAEPAPAPADAAKKDEPKADESKADASKKEEAKPAEAPANAGAPKAEAPKGEPAKPADTSKPAETPKR